MQWLSRLVRMDERKTGRGSLHASMLQATLDIWRQVGGQHVISLKGGSMLPLIRDGDRVVVAHNWTRVRRGDVVVFRRGEALIIHRVLRIRRGPFGPIVVTKGDNRASCDPPLSAQQLVGRVGAVSRGDRQVALDTCRWRTVGWLIAVTTLAWMHLDGWGRACKRRILGSQPNRLTAALRRSLLACSILALTGVQAALWRW